MSLLTCSAGRFAVRARDAALRACPTLGTGTPRWPQTSVRRMAQVSANDMREGDLLELAEGGLWRVVARQFSRTAQGRAYVQTELRHLTEGTKKDVRFRSDDMVEKADLDTPAKMQVLYTKGDAVHVMDVKTCEQTEIAAALLGEQARFVTDGMILFVESYRGAPAIVSLPLKAGFAIATMDAGAGSAVLDCGHRLRVPKHLKVGDRITIDTRDGSYVGKEQS